MMRPTVLFERHTLKKEEPERYFACSASRDRKLCSFYQRLSDTATKGQNNGKQRHSNKGVQVCESHGQYLKRGKRFQALPVFERTLCVTCGLLLMAEEQSAHSTHSLKREVSDKALLYPSTLLQPLVTNKANAQYLFSERTVQFITTSVKSLGFKKVLCLGVPRLHEEIQTHHKESGLSSLLLDIDQRFMQFYKPESFIRYNMFNNYFFSGEKSKQILNRFLLEDSGPVLLVTDPPFGGLAELLATSIRALSLQWRATNDINSSDTLLPLLWFFPYFLEHKVTASLPGLQMLDYKVEYENHAKFKNKQDSNTGSMKAKQGSVVRIFTNLSPSTVKLPTGEGYRFCKLCERYISKENRHCTKCKACTSKDGSTYRHCDECKRCVKPSKQHCHTCGFCVLPGHDPCTADSTGPMKNQSSLAESLSTTNTENTCTRQKRKKNLKRAEKLKSKKMKLSKKP